MNYQVVFDVTKSGFDWTFGAFGFIFVIVGIGLVRYRELIRSKTIRPLRGIFPFLFLGFAVLWTIGAFATTYLHHARAVETLRSGRAQMLEGTITQFVSSQKQESFVLAGRKFSYSDYVITGCFNNMSSHGGPMRDGARVRLWTVQNCIVKLEIARDGHP